MKSLGFLFLDLQLLLLPSFLALPLLCPPLPTLSPLPIKVGHSNGEGRNVKPSKGLLSIIKAYK